MCFDSLSAPRTHERRDLDAPIVSRHSERRACDIDDVGKMPNRGGTVQRSPSPACVEPPGGTVPPLRVAHQDTHIVVELKDADIVVIRAER